MISPNLTLTLSQVPVEVYLDEAFAFWDAALADAGAH